MPALRSHWARCGPLGPGGGSAWALEQQHEQGNVHVHEHEHEVVTARTKPEPVLTAGQETPAQNRFHMRTGDVFGNERAAESCLTPRSRSPDLPSDPVECQSL